MTKKNKKQEQVSNTFSLDNIAKANAFFNENKTKNKTKNIITSLRFKIHMDYIELFHKLRMEYAQNNNNFGFSYNNMFEVGINFVYHSFKEKGILEKCDENFKTAMIKPGRRKKNKRTYPNHLTSSLVLSVFVPTADKYMDIMYSYILANPNDNLFNHHHSRTYFFYDFLDYIKKNKKNFLEFALV